MATLPAWIKQTLNGSGSSPTSICGNSTSIFAGSTTDNKVYRLRPSDLAFLKISDGTVGTSAQAAYSPGSQPYVLACSNVYLWVGCANGNLYRYRLSDGVNDWTLAGGSVGGFAQAFSWSHYCRGMNFGGYTWLPIRNGSDTAGGALRLADDGSYVFYALGGKGMWWCFPAPDGSGLWISGNNNDAGKLRKIDASGNVLTTITKASGGTCGQYAVGSNGYAIGQFGGTTNVRLLNMTTGAESGDIYCYGINPTQWESDGTYAWAGAMSGLTPALMFGFDGTLIAGLYSGGSIPNLVKVGNSLYYQQGYAQTTVVKYDVVIQEPPPQIQSINPTAGKKIRITADKDVTLGTPTIGPKVGPVKVLSATQVSSKVIDVNLDIHAPVTGIGY